MFGSDSQVLLTRARRALVVLSLVTFIVPHTFGGHVSGQIPAPELQGRRVRLFEAIGDGLYYFAGAPSPPNDYTLFFQDPDFLYLTGLSEPGARLLMLKNGARTRAVLLYTPGDPSSVIWQGPVPTAAEAAAFTALEIATLRDFGEVLDEMLGTGPKVLVSQPGPDRDPTAAAILERMGGNPSVAPPRRGTEWQAGDVKVVSPSGALRDMRTIKSETEIELLRMASRITREAHLEAMRATAPGLNEFEIQALIEYTFRRNGAGRPGFASIVGSGPNSTVLHYNRNDRYMEAGDMLVMDIGASYGGYTTDITRSIPVSGTFTSEQRAIYELVLEVSLAAERLAVEAGTPYEVLTREAQRIFAEGLARMGLTEGPDAVLPGSGRPQWSLYFMHGLGHGIGLVVHDSMTRTMEPGNCFTVEPGLYIRPDALDRIGAGPEADALREKLRPAVERYANIGVRIEDSYVFTSAGLERLSAGIPRTVQEVEAVMAEPSVTMGSRVPELIEAYRKHKPPLP